MAGATPEEGAADALMDGEGAGSGGNDAGSAGTPRTALAAQLLPPWAPAAQQRPSQSLSLPARGPRRTLSHEAAAEGVVEILSRHGVPINTVETAVDEPDATPHRPVKRRAGPLKTAVRTSVGGELNALARIRRNGTEEPDFPLSFAVAIMPFTLGGEAAKVAAGAEGSSRQPMDSVVASGAALNDVRRHYNHHHGKVATVSALPAIGRLGRL